MAHCRVSADPGSFYRTFLLAWRCRSSHIMATLNLSSVYTTLPLHASIDLTNTRHRTRKAGPASGAGRANTFAPCVDFLNAIIAGHNQCSNIRVQPARCILSLVHEKYDGSLAHFSDACT